MKALKIAFAALAIATPAAADAPAKPMEDLLTEYVRLWNAGDAETITSRIYKFAAPGNPMQTKAGLEAEFARLKSQGYHHSETHSVNGCLVGPNDGFAVLRYTRLKADGQPMPPKDRATLYILRRLPEGWRITQMIGMNAATEISCKSAAAG